MASVEYYPVSLLTMEVQNDSMEENWLFGVGQ